MGVNRRAQGTEGVTQITFAQALVKMKEWGGVARIYGYARSGSTRPNRVYQVSATAEIINGKNGDFFRAVRMRYDRSENRYIPDPDDVESIRSIDIQYITPQISGAVNGTWIRVCD